MSFDQYGTVAASPYIPLDQRLAEEEGVTWRTPALAQPLTLTGPSALHLVAASTASDTDWFAKLSDVAPDGSESIITSGFLRASHRALDPARTTPDVPWHTNTDPKPIEPGRNYDYDLAIWPTAYELARGHRLDDPGSTAFTPLSPATNTVATGGADASYLRITALGAAPPAAPASAPSRPRACRRTIALPHARGRRFVRAVAYAGRRRVAKRAGRDIRRLVVPGGRTLRVVLTTRHGRRIVLRRRVKDCG